MGKITDKKSFKELNEGRKINFVSDAEEAKAVAEENSSVTVFTDGKAKTTIEDRLACAKIVSYKSNGKDKHTYFIRKYSQGDWKGHFYNPVNAVEVDFLARSRVGGEERYKWVKVSKGMYQTYERFLISRNPVYLTQLNMEYTNNGQTP